MDGIREAKKVRVFVHMVILDGDAPLYGLSVPTVVTLSGEDAYSLRVIAIRKDKTRKRVRESSAHAMWENVYCTHKGQTHEVYKSDGQKLFLCDACYKQYLIYAIKDAMEGVTEPTGRKKVVGIVKSYNKKTRIAEIAILTCPRCTSRDILLSLSGRYYHCNRCNNEWPVDSSKKGWSNVKLQDDMSKM